MPALSDKYIKYAPPVLPLDKQSVEVPGTKRPGQTGHYRSNVFGYLDVNDPSNMTTLTTAFEHALSLGHDRPFLGHRPVVSTSPLKYADHFVWQSYGQIDARRKRVGSALCKLFDTGALGGSDLPTVGIWAPNCPEWQVVDLACQAYNKVSVSLYDTLGAESVEYIINHAHLSIVFSSSEHLPALLRLKGSSKAPMIKYVVSIDDLPAQPSKILKAWGDSTGVKVLSLSEFEQFGEEVLIQPIPATPEQIVSLCFTSGTTSNPKGVVLTHCNLAMGVQSNLCGMVMSNEACLLSYLPLAHIYERICEISMYALGGQIGYFTGDPLRLLEDAQILKPNFFPSVPRVLNRIYQAAMSAGSAPGIKGALFRKAVEAKLHRLRTTGDWTHPFWDRLVFKNVQAVLGGRIELICVGSAPINAAVIDFLKIAFACHVEEGYGMTENSATCTRCYANDIDSAGTVGAVQPCNEIKLVDVPTMGYTSEDKPYPRGEICVRGPNCFSVYYKDEKNTKSTVDEEGFVHTGDVGEFDNCGRLKIIDRIKNIMKLAQGEYVALEKIENLYSASPVVQQIYVHGEGLQSYLVAVVIPDPIKLAPLVSSHLGKKVSPEDIKAMTSCMNEPAVAEHFLALLNQEAKRSDLKGFETIKRVHLTFDLFSVDDGTLTPTMKIKRKDAYLKHKAAIDALYALGEPTTTASSRL